MERLSGMEKAHYQNIVGQKPAWKPEFGRTLVESPIEIPKELLKPETKIIDRAANNKEKQKIAWLTTLEIIMETRDVCKKEINIIENSMVSMRRNAGIAMQINRMRAKNIRK